MRRRRSPPATRTTRGSETLAHALSADRQDDKTLFCVSAVSAFSSPPDAVIDRGALRNDYETMSTRRGGVQWPDSDGSFHLCVAGWSVGQGVSPCTRVCVVVCCSIRSAAAARRWTVLCVRGGFYEIYYYKKSMPLECSTFVARPYLPARRGQERAAL